MDVSDKYIFVDVDECLLETQQQFVNCLSEKFGEEHRERYDEMKKAWKWTVLTGKEQEYAWTGETGYHSLDFQSKLKFKSKARKTLKALTKLAKGCIIVTDSPKSIQDYREQMMKAAFPKTEIFFTKHRYSQNQKGDFVSKSDIVRRYNQPSIVIDDAPHHIEAYSELDNVKHIIVFDMPYNQDIKNDKIVRVNSWKEIGELIG